MKGCPGCTWLARVREHHLAGLREPSHKKNAADQHVPECSRGKEEKRIEKK